MADDREKLGVISAITSATIRSMYALCSEMNSFVMFQNASILMGAFLARLGNCLVIILGCQEVCGGCNTNTVEQ
jgi:hypothetical protein